MNAARPRLAELAEPILPDRLGRRYAYARQAAEAPFTELSPETMNDRPDSDDGKQRSDDDVQEDQGRERHGTSCAFSTFAVATI